MAEKDTNQDKPAKPAPAAKDIAAKAKGEAKAAAAKSKGKSGAIKTDEGVYKPEGERVEPRLQARFKTQVRKLLAEKHGISNPMRQPRLDKIVLNVNMGRHLEGTKIPANVRSTVLDTLIRVTGQKPVVVKAKKSVSNFKVREGLESAAMVTLRRDRMWHFLDRLLNLAAPRIKDFRGVSEKAFDKQGNYAFGLTEQGVFPEINMAEATFTHGMNINLCFKNSTPELSRAVLTELGMPFRKPEENRRRS
ncbi:MAG: 50S ribosomal protein L5 [bacterium]|jgi:large subunit ribosomal protein L5|nr:50S ribosomal protein L5 [Phycisphaeraceae bacterium]